MSHRLFNKGVKITWPFINEVEDNSRFVQIFGNKDKEGVYRYGSIFYKQMTIERSIHLMILKV
jgi:hypothetical protein